MERININFSKEKLDDYLKQNYGYRYWNFADSIFSIFLSYRSRPYSKTVEITKERIKRIEKTKDKFIELIDDLLSEINFYEYSKLHQSMKFIKYLWTPNNKKKFIEDKFRLNYSFAVLEDMIKSYNSKVSIFHSFREKIYLKPINLLILAWSNALRKGNRIHWINLEMLLKWFLNKLDEIQILDAVGIEEPINKIVPSPERMRFISNKYRGTKHKILADSIFFRSFKDENEISEMKKWHLNSPDGEFVDYSDPLKFLYETMWKEKSPKGYLSLFDLGVSYFLLED